ncbi:MAG: DUF3267 domain-containing protein [Ignavibacteria bacterium]|nr:DUF3267 domain-containing protein [Ignavibacteria bacterium]
MSYFEKLKNPKENFDPYNPETLQSSGYENKLTLYHADILPFIKSSLKFKNIYSVSYYVFNLIFVVCLIFYSSYFYGLNNVFKDVIYYIGIGFAGAFLLLPLHEWIHGLAYKFCGAKKVNYKADFKNLVVMAIADRFVVNALQIIFVALAPFVVITSLFLFALFFVSSPYNLTVISIIVVHTSFCIGDFGICAYIKQNQNQGIITYDDFENKVSYFLVKKD